MCEIFSTTDAINIYNLMLLFSHHTSIAPCTRGQLRLLGSNLANEGGVEICINNAWGAVCGDYWESTDVTVVCRQLGYLTQGQ